MLRLIVPLILIDLASSKLGVRVYTVELLSPQCVNCESIQSKCTVYREGYFCAHHEDKAIIHKTHIYSMARTGNELDSCVPPVYNITGPIMDYCCIWTPEKGCQQVAGHLYQNHSDWEETCDICLKSCACSEFRSISIGVRLTSSMSWILLVVNVMLLLLNL